MSNEYTFQRLWKVSVGQYVDGGFSSVFEITENRLIANISASSKNSSGVETQKASVFRLYNLGYDLINILSNYNNLFIKITAGYLYQNGVRGSVDNLPVLYIGNIFYTNTTTMSADTVTTLYATPAFEKVTNSISNLQFKAGTNEKKLITRLAEDIGLPIRFLTDKNFGNLPRSARVEGSTSTHLDIWCKKNAVRNYIERGVIYIVDKEVKTADRKKHILPPEIIKGVAEVSVDLTKILKEKTKPAPSIKLKTFLNPLINLQDEVEVSLVDYTKDQSKERVYTTQTFIVDKYEHELDSHGRTWDTKIEGKGGV